jgi:ADP-ribose pyrophosphatase
MPAHHYLLAPNRELQEETGYTAREWVKAGVLHPLLLIPLKSSTFWFARGLTLGEQQLSGEFLEVFSATPDAR